MIANHIRRAHERNPDKPVFVKYDGRLEELVYGIPRDRTHLIKDIHQYFRDCPFVIVHKADTPRMRDLLGRFVKKYELAEDQVERVRMFDNGGMERLGP